MTRTIRFRRPELPYGVARIFVPPEVDTAAKVRYLQGLGYMIVDDTPRLAGQATSLGMIGTPKADEAMP